MWKVQISVPIADGFISSHQSARLMGKILMQKSRAAVRGTPQSRMKPEGTLCMGITATSLSYDLMGQTQLKRSAICLPVSLFFWLTWVWKYSTAWPQPYLIEDSSAWSSSKQPRGRAFVLSLPCSVPVLPTGHAEGGRRNPTHTK